jgi:hypothetical protein
MDNRNLLMSGFDLPTRRMGGSRKSGLKKWRQVDLALKSMKIEGEARWRI